MNHREVYYISYVYVRKAVIINISTFSTLAEHFLSMISAGDQRKYFQKGHFFEKKSCSDKNLKCLRQHF